MANSEKEIQKKYILFDLDGTLTDPKVGICTCVQYALASFGIEEPDLDKLEPFIGPPLTDSFMEFYDFSEEDAKKAVEKYRERFSTVGLFENEVYKGIPHMLKRLKKNGFHLAVASSKPTIFVEKILKHFKLDSYFEAVVGSNLDGTRVDKKEVIDEALKQLFKGNRINKDLIYMVGDRKFDIIGAKEQGVSSIAVAFGYGEFEELWHEKPDYIVFTPNELEELIMRESNEYSEGRVSRIKGLAGEMISYKAILTLLCCFLVFVLLRGGAYLALTDIVSRISPFIPDPVWNYLNNEINTSSAFYNGNLGTVISGLSYLIAAIPVGIFARKLIKRTSRDTYLLHPMNPSVLQIIFGVLFVISFTLATQIATALTQIAASSESYAEVAKNQYSCDILIGIIVYCLIAPLAEELLFRGVLYTTFRRYTPVFVAIIASSVLFGVYHGNLVQGIYAFIFGVLIAIGYEYYGAFLAAVMMHALQNIVSYIGTYTFMNNKIFMNAIFASIMGVVALGSAVMLFRLKKGTH